MKKKSILILIYFSIVSFSIKSNDWTIIKAGIYQNPPKVFINNEGEVKGFIPEIFNKIAEEENWEIEYIFDSWENNFIRLQNGDIDVLLDVSYTPERDNYLTFTSLPVIESWLQVYKVRGTPEYGKIGDFAKKKIAVLKGSVQENYLQKNIRDLYDINFEIITFKNYSSSVKALLKGEVDLLVADRFYYFSHNRSDKIVPTSIVFYPSGIHFAFKKGSNLDLKYKIDKRIASMKNDPDSKYYSILERYLYLSGENDIPQSVKILGSILIISIVISFFIMFYLKYAVRKRTKELNELNISLRNVSRDLNDSLKKTQKREKELDLMLNEKEVLIAELFHRTRNNMQTMASILNLEKNKIDDKNVKAAFLDSINVINAMALVHSILYETNELSRIDLVELVKRLSLQIRSAFGFKKENVEYHFLLNQSIVLFDYAVPFGVVLNDMVSPEIKT